MVKLGITFVKNVRTTSSATIVISWMPWIQLEIKINEKSSYLEGVWNWVKSLSWPYFTGGFLIVSICGGGINGLGVFIRYLCEFRDSKSKSIFCEKDNFTKLNNKDVTRKFRLLFYWQPNRGCWGERMDRTRGNRFELTYRQQGQPFRTNQRRQALQTDTPAPQNRAHWWSNVQFE